MSGKLLNPFLCAAITLWSVCSTTGSSAQVLTTIAGNGASSYSGDGGQATAAGLGETFGVITDNAGNVYFAESSSNRVRKIDPSGIVTTIAGTGTHSYGGDGGPATAADLAFPSGLAFDHAGNLYVSDPNNSRVRKIDTFGIITTFAGTGTPGFSGDGGPATAAQIGYSDGVFVDIYDNVFIPDPPNHRIRMVNTAGIITTFAGTGASGTMGDGGPATAAAITNPADLRIDQAGNLYFTDYTDNRVRMIDASGIINTICGNGTMGSSGDGGPATAATLFGPVGIELDKCGNIYIADRSNHKVRKIDLGGIITTVAGTGSTTFAGDGGPASTATLNAPHGLHIDAAGNLLIADRYNYRIRKINNFIDNHIPYSAAGSSPIMIRACSNGTARSIDTVLAAIDSDLSQNITWRIVGAPAHGSVAGFPATGTTTGGFTYPSGLSYNPSVGYTGYDTLRVLVSDCYADNVITLIVQGEANPDAGAISGVDSVCPGKTITLTSSMPGGAWMASNTALGTVSVSGVVSGIAAGVDTFRYVVFNSCGADTAFFKVKIRSNAACMAGVHDLTSPLAGSVLVAPNPSDGSFVVTVASVVGESVDVTVTNMLGQKVKEMTMLTNAATPLSLGQSSGVYLITVHTSQGILSAKVLIGK